MNQKKFILFLIFLLATTIGIADTRQYAKENIAINGYDPVSYFTSGQPEIGESEISVDWNGAVWRFVSEEHKNIFVSNPEKYACRAQELHRCR